MPTYEEFMYSSSRKLPTGVQVKRIGNIEEITVNNDLKKCLKSVIIPFVPFILLSTLLFLAFYLDFEDGFEAIIFLGILDLLVVLIILSNIKMMLTKNVLMFNTTTRNFSMCRQWPFGRSKPQEFISGTATPLIVVTKAAANNVDFSFFVSNCPPDYNFTIFDIKKFPTFLPAPMTRPMMNWMYQLVQAIQDRDITLPEKKVIKSSDMNKRAMEEFGNLKVVQGMEKLSKIPEPAKIIAEKIIDDLSDKDNRL